MNKKKSHLVIVTQKQLAFFLFFSFLLVEDKSVKLHAFGNIITGREQYLSYADIMSFTCEDKFDYLDFARV
jgi:hypothetical protein